MAESDDLKRENEALRRRIATLHAAILRINASLDLDTVLGEVVQSARTLTGARWGVIAIVDEAGAPLDFVFSGFTPEEERELAAWPERARLFEHFRSLPGPLRLADLSVHVRALGIEPAPLFSRSFQGTPMRHHGADIGSFFLADKARGEAFTGEDEEVLTLFASQAASAIVNARTHRDERRARADLEALVETSPLGVLVLDAASGRAVSFNREARRIAERLRLPGQPPEQLLEAMTVRRTDGTEVNLNEFPGRGVARQRRDGAHRGDVDLGAGRAQRARAGQRHADPRRGRRRGWHHRLGGDDRPGPRAARRDRAAAHRVPRPGEPRAARAAGRHQGLGGDAESRTPPRSTRPRCASSTASSPSRRATCGASSATCSMRAASTRAHSRLRRSPSEVAELVERARNTFVGGGGRHGIHVDLPAGLPRAMADRRRIVQVLNNLFANAARHAPESSPIRVSVAREDAHVAVSVADEGRGVAAEQLPRLFDKHAGSGPGAGYGLGLAICKGLVEAHGGRIRAESAGPGRGATVTFTLPAAGETGAGTAAEPSPDRPPDEPARILVIDDDPRTLHFARNALTRAGYAPLVTGEPEDLARLIRSEKPRLVLLDLVLPGRDGITLMQEVPDLSDVPVIFISGYGRDETVAAAFEAGAADYIVKPFSQTELVARVRAALRRREAPGPFVLGDLAIDHARRRVTVRGEPVDLTATEYKLLRVLALDAGRVVTYKTLLRRVWNGREGDEAHLVRIMVRSLRRKLGDAAANPAWIFNERGVGYRMPAPGQD